MPIRHVLFLGAHHTHINGVLRVAPGARKYQFASHVADLARIRQRRLAMAAGKERRGAVYSSSWDDALCSKNERQSRAMGLTRPCSVSAAQK